MIKTISLILATGIGIYLPLPAASQSQCGFNGRYEACKVYLSISSGVEKRKVIWLSDGKTVTYYAYSCSKPDEYAGAYSCKARITEDNGRVTYGTHNYRGGGRIFIESMRGNTTALPYR